MLTKREVRILMLTYRLQADALNYTPLSFKAQRAARLIPKLLKLLEAV